MIKTLKIDAQLEHVDEITIAINKINRAMTTIRLLSTGSMATHIALDAIKHATTNLHFAKESLIKSLQDDHINTSSKETTQ